MLIFTALKALFGLVTGGSGDELVKAGEQAGWMLFAWKVAVAATGTGFYRWMALLCVILMGVLVYFHRKDSGLGSNFSLFRLVGAIPLAVVSIVLLMSVTVAMFQSAYTTLHPVPTAPVKTSTQANPAPAVAPVQLAPAGSPRAPDSGWYAPQALGLPLA